MAAFPAAAVAVDVMKVNQFEISSDSRIGFNLKRRSLKEMCIAFLPNCGDVTKVIGVEYIGEFPCGKFSSRCRGCAAV